MPTDCMVVLQGVSNLPQDRYVNTLHFSDPGLGEGEADEIWSKYDALITDALGGLADSGHSVRFYAPGVNPSGPYYAKEYSSTSSRPTSAPTEVACCLSYATVDDPEASTPRRRGRIYVGPFGPNLVQGARPNALLQDLVLDLGEGLAQVGFASNNSWMLYSQRDDSYHKIESIWVDDAWDTQRRRGIAPTARTVRDVQ